MISIGARRKVPSLNWSPLTRKTIFFNLIALNILVIGVLYLNSSGDRLDAFRRQSLIAKAELIANVFEDRAALRGMSDLETEAKREWSETLSDIDPYYSADVYVFNSDIELIEVSRMASMGIETLQPGGTVITDLLTWISVKVSEGLSLVLGRRFGPETTLNQLQELLKDSTPLNHIVQPIAKRVRNANGRPVFIVGAPILRSGRPVGAIGLVQVENEIDALIRVEHEQLLQMFIVASLVSIGLSVLLASTIANPLSDLADAAELGRYRNRRNAARGRIRIPDLTARPDEIGRLSGALRGMVSALYDRIDSNEQFAADVAHEIKNPLASLRSAVGTMRVAKREDQQEKLLCVIEHDVRRLDRLVSDISNASRLDSELVKEEEVQFNLFDMLKNVANILAEDAKRTGVDMIIDLPDRPMQFQGLEARLAQVFVNLLTNALSFCEDGDAIRVWARQRESRVLLVVEDTGPGIPEQALSKIFERFYSERPESDFGNNSGLGLAISKQIVEAHGGVIWAENIRPTAADVTSEPRGARFVVGLPV